MRTNAELLRIRQCKITLLANLPSTDSHLCGLGDDEKHPGISDLLFSVRMGKEL